MLGTLTTIREYTVSFASQATQQKFPFPYDDVFNGLAQVLPALGMNVKEADKVIGRINASTGMSLFSWGENLSLIVEKVDESSCVVGIESGLKVSINAAGAHRHQKNFNNIISALSKLRGIGLPKNAASCGEWTRRDSGVVVDASRPPQRGSE